jgi:uncharacterized membrane protein YkoI
MTRIGRHTMKRNWLQRVAVIAVSVLLAVSVAYAGREHGKESDEALALAKTKINLTQAIAAAEQHLQGKAIRAELEDENGTFVYGVEVAEGNSVKDVKVSALDGKILSVQADREDRHGERERESERDER